MLNLKEPDSASWVRTSRKIRRQSKQGTPSGRHLLHRRDGHSRAGRQRRVNIHPQGHFDGVRRLKVGAASFGGDSGQGRSKPGANPVQARSATGLAPALHRPCTGIGAALV
jgi:hypothetical protein